MMEKFVLLTFTAGCMSESSIAVGQQQAKRSKLDTNLIPTSKEEEEEGHGEQDDEESLSGENLKSPSSLLALLKFQKLFKNFKNFSQSFAYKDDELEEEEEELGIEIGFPTDVKHVTHIGLDSCASSILSKSWDHEHNQTIKVPPFPLSPLELAMVKHTTENPTFRSLLETK